MAKKRTNEHEAIRKLAERTETVERKLTQIEIENEREKVINLLSQRDEAEAEWESKKATNKAAMKAIDSKIEAARGAIRRGRVDEEVVIEEWLTRGNEVVRTNKATGLELGRRTATRDELQEELPLAKPDDAPPPDAEDDGERELANEVAEDFGGDA